MPDFIQRDDTIQPLPGTIWKHYKGSECGHAVMFGDRFSTFLDRDYDISSRVYNNNKKKRHTQKKARAITRKHRK